jgi:hypothetical protein
LKRNILVVSEFFSVGGLETQILGQIETLGAMGCRMHLATSSPPSEAAIRAFASCAFDVPMSYGRSARDLLSAIEQLNDICGAERVDLIHAHPFLSMIIAGCVAQQQHLPLAVTLHGPLSTGVGGQESIANLMWEKSILPRAGTIFAVSPETRLMCRMATTRDVVVLPNAVKVGPEEPAPVSPDLPWMWAGRMDADKVVGLHQLIDFVASSDGIRLDVFGSGPAGAEVENRISALGISRETIAIRGWHADLPSIMPNYGVICGMGRVMLEGGRAGRACLLVGYDGVKGFLTEGKAIRASSWNLSGRGLRNINMTEFSAQITELKANQKDFLIYDWVRRDRNSSRTWPKFYSAVSNIPPFCHEGVDIFLEVLENAGDMPTDFWSSSTCFQILKSSLSVVEQRLVERSEQLKSFSKTEQMDCRRWNLQRSEIDATESSLESELMETKSCLAQVAQERDEAIKLRDALLTSTSWRLMEPGRAFMRMLHRLEDSRRCGVRRVYRCVPARIRWHIDKIRYQQRSRRQEGRTSSPTWVVQARATQKVVFLTSGFEFDELVNQRPINLAKFLAAQDYSVFFVAWQWHEEEKLQKSGLQVWPGVYQVSLYEFLSGVEQLDASGNDSHIIVTLPAPIIVESLTSLRGLGMGIIYDIMDEWEEFAKVGQAPWYERMWEEQLVLQADHVTAVAPSLVDKFAHLRRDLQLVPNGFEPTVIGEANRFIVTEPDGNSELTVGYFGHLTDAWFDWTTVLSAARQDPSIRFEIIGYGAPEWVERECKSLANVNLVGSIQPSSLFRYVLKWNVAMIPFIEGKLSEAVDPIKVYEYIYFGLPVVATGISHLRAYPRTMVTTPANFLLALKFASQSPKNLEKTEVFLENAKWAVRFREIARRLETKGLQTFYAA